MCGKGLTACVIDAWAWAWRVNGVLLNACAVQVLVPRQGYLCTIASQAWPYFQVQAEHDGAASISAAQSRMQLTAVPC